MHIESTTNTVEAASAGRETLVFGLGREEYAIDIAHVQEIRGYDVVTRMANAPDYLKGVVSLRGVIVPLVDLRIRFGLGAPRYDASTVVIVLTLGASTVGIVVDSVADVLTLAPEQLRPAPQMGGTAVDHVLAIATHDERMLIVVDIAAVLGDMGMLERARLAA